MFFRAVIRETAYKYLGCGDLRQGFARVRCRDCGHENLLAYSCKGRYFCTSCHTKRAVAFAEWLHSTVLWPVAHRQIVLTIPRMLRIRVRYDRRLLGDPCRVAAGVIVEICDPPDFLAAVTCHIPNRGDHPVRSSARQSSVQRDRRRRQGVE